MKLDQISSRAWEHPADRAALNTLRAIPGFDEIVRKVASYFGERGVRQLFLANAVRVSDQQRPQLNAMWTDVLDTLDWPTRPQLYVTQTPFVNAYAVGFEDPFVVMSSSMLEILNEDEQRFVLAHELGHIMSGHTTYRTIALIIMWVGIRNLPFLAGLALLPFQLALLEWYRKSEFSCDRAGLLAIQNLDVAMGGFMKLAGGKATSDTEASLEEFMRQAEEYETGGTAWDTVFRVLNTALRDHPFNTVRASELLKWHRTGAYDTIIGGTYVRRDEPGQPLGDDISDAAGYYGDQTRSAVKQFEDVFARAKDAFNEAWRGTPK